MILINNQFSLLKFIANYSSKVYWFNALLSMANQKIKEVSKIYDKHNIRRLHETDLVNLLSWSILVNIHISLELL